MFGNSSSEIIIIDPVEVCVVKTDIQPMTQVSDISEPSSSIKLELKKSMSPITIKDSDETVTDKE